MNEERSAKSIELGNYIAKFAKYLIEPTGCDIGIALGALVSAEGILLKAAGINPVEYYQKLLEEVQNAIDKELR